MLHHVLCVCVCVEDCVCVGDCVWMVVSRGFSTFYSFFFYIFVKYYLPIVSIFIVCSGNEVKRGVE